MSPDPKMPPLPRDHAAPSLTEILPFGSRKISLRRSSFLAPGLATSLLVVYLFIALQNLQGAADVIRYGRVLGSYLLFMMFWMIYAYSGTRRPIWAYIFPASITALILATPLIILFVLVFRHLLPGAKVPDGSPFAAQFGAMFFGAGLMEELIKAVPILMGAGLGLLLARRPGSRRFWEHLTVRTPLDGVLFGVASGAAFIAIETFYQYFTGTITKVATGTKNEILGLLIGVLLLIPRTLDTIIGHMGYSGIMGYFIGLATVRRSGALLLILGGWLAASVLHALWNSVAAVSPYLYYAVALATFVVFLACLMKAKQLEPLLTGQAAAASGSIVVGAPGAPRPAVPAVPLARPASTVAAPFALHAGGVTVTLAPGARIDIGERIGPGAAGLACEVTAHPEDPDVLGLKNLGASAWTATGPDGTSRAVPPGRNLRLAAGTRIDFGPLAGEILAGP